VSARETFSGSAQARGAATVNPPAPTVALNIIVAEEDDSSRDNLVASVRLLGHRCRAARDGLQAWQMQLDERADAILANLQMPGMDGLELCRRTRVANDNDAYTYFIFMTDLADKDHFLKGMEAGADDYHTKPVDIDELRARLVSASRVVALYKRLAEQNAVLRRDSQTSFRQARTDALTQVANRLAMEEDFKVLWARAKRYRHRYSLAICDVDTFKAYNDRFGHLAGDEVLRRVAATLREKLREGDGLYRYGGDEFVVLLPEQSLSEAGRALERIRLAVEELAIPGVQDDRSVTLSFGVAELQQATDASPEDWLRRADAALYKAKSEGRNRLDIDAPQPRQDLRG
jgi:two-component system chemotaxis response regulator CheY